MKKKLLCLVLFLILTGCGQKPDALPPIEEAQEEVKPDREETAEMVFTVEGQEKTVPVTLYTGEGYSIYIPDEGWSLEKNTDGDIPKESWRNTINDDVALSVSRCGGKTYMEARDAFMGDCGYIFEDGMGGQFGDPLTGMDDDGGFLCFMTAEGAGGTFLISWEYPAEAAEGFGRRLEQLAGTFALTE